jgi:recombination protein RecA
MAKKKEEKKESFADVLARVNKTYGAGAIMKLNDKCKDDYDIISTGSIGIDYEVLGVGGIVLGKLYELIGWEGTGKSTLCGHITANCQKAGGKVVYIDGEHAVDKNYFKALGVNIDEMLLSQPTNGEEGFNIAMEMIKTGEVSLVIIDSDSSLMPKKVVDGEVGDSAIGRKAYLNSNAYPKLKTKLVETNTAMIVISQYREKIGVMFGDPRTTQGGHALKFYSDCRMEIAKSLDKDGTDVIGHTTRVKTIENK